MKWNKKRLEELLPLVAEEIQMIHPGNQATEDIYVWQPLQTGKYTAKRQICLPPSGVSSTILPWVCWALWTARNTLLFEKRTFTPTEVATKAIRLAREWVNAQAHQTQSTNVLPHPKRKHQFRSATGDTPTCKSDAAYDAQSRRAGLAWIINKPSGRMIHQESRTQNFVPSPLVAEALALRAGLIDAVKLELPKLRMLSDNSTLVRAINNDAQAKEIFGIINDIQQISSAFVEISFTHISRSFNEDADRLAKLSLSTS
ncbi:hypothetical protein F2Q68_00012423 [Brassica cretica]|nr:hypothetical protein F2Q68_00012423 [Brassica cretica]